MANQLMFAGPALIIGLMASINAAGKIDDGVEDWKAPMTDIWMHWPGMIEIVSKPER